jgi:tRNA threonylcarbamoyladenosine biosynthesis protein TsaB
LDAAFGPLSVAVAQGNRFLAAAEGRADLRAAEHLPGLVTDTLARAGVRMDQISRIAVTLGPGGFTSLRSGLAFAKGLAFAATIPLLGFTTLEALALSVASGDLPIVAVIDAKRDEVFLQCFAPNCAPVSEPAAVPLADLLKALPPHGLFLVCGSGAHFVAGLVGDRAQATGLTLPRASAIASVAGARSLSAYPAEAVYLRPADARPMAQP